MAQPDGFMHITVTPEQDDDVVIRAGADALRPIEAPVNGDAASAAVEQVPAAVAAAERETASSSPNGKAEDMQGSTGAVPPDGASKTQASSAAGEADPAADAKEAKPARGKAEKRAARTRAKDDGYRETTLEDLDVGPMSLTQKVVIAAVVVCLIGAVAYYMLFMA